MGANWFPLWLSLRVAGLATVISLLMGLWLAWLLASREFRGKGAIETLLALPLIFPPTIMVCYFLIRITRRMAFTWQVAVAAALVYAFPFLVRSARASFRNLDRGYEDAARSLGASEWRVFWRIALPLAYRPILTAATLVFARVLTECAATLLIAASLDGAL
ncbi:MAG: ABC transporter permease subunit [Bryobacteraceae bacterium]|jgi:molybdate transport system permease protein